MIPSLSQIDRNDTVFVALKHELRLTRRDAPELDRAVFGARDDPLAVGRYGNGQNVVLGERQRWPEVL